MRDIPVEFQTGVDDEGFPTIFRDGDSCRVLVFLYDAKMSDNAIGHALNGSTFNRSTINGSTINGKYTSLVTLNRG